MKKITLPDFKIKEIEDNDVLFGGGSSVIYGDVQKKKFCISPQMLLADMDERVSTLEALSTDPYNEIKEQLAKDTEAIGTIFYNIGSIKYDCATKYGTSLTYDADAKSMSLVSSNGTVLTTISVSDFVRDGFLSNVEMVADPDGQEKGVYLLFTFNTDAGKEDVYVNVTDLIDLYNSTDSIDVVNGDARTISVNEDWLQDQDEKNITYTDNYGTGLQIGTITVGEKTYAVYIPYATLQQYGVVKPANGIAVEDGAIYADVLYTDKQSAGEIIGTLSVGVTDTDVTVQYGTNEQYGITKAGVGILSTDVGEWYLDEQYLYDFIEHHPTIINHGERITQAEADIDSLEERMDIAEADIDQAEADIDALEERMDEAEADIDHLETRMSNAETAIETNANNITTNLFNIQTLFSKVQTLQDDLTENATNELSAYGKRLGYEAETNLLSLYATDGTELSSLDLTDLQDTYTAGDGVVISNKEISTDDEYIVGLNEIMTVSELDTLIYAVEGQASYGMASAMGIA